NDGEGERCSLGKGKRMKFFSSILALLMVFSMFVSPLSAFAKSEQEQTLNKTLQDESTLQVKAAVAEQLKILEGEPTLHKELEGLSGNEDVPVIVHLSEKPVALEMGIKKLAGDELSSAETKKIKKEVRAQQTFVKKEMNVN